MSMSDAFKKATEDLMPESKPRKIRVKLNIVESPEL